jgi:hypothetical protein
MENFSFEKLQVPLVFALLTLGGIFPKSPKIVQDYAKFEWVQWMLLFVVMYFLASGRDAPTAVVATLCIFAIYKVLDLIYVRKETYY